MLGVVIAGTPKVNQIQEFNNMSSMQNVLGNMIVPNKQERSTQTALGAVQVCVQGVAC